MNDTLIKYGSVMGLLAGGGIAYYNKSSVFQIVLFALIGGAIGTIPKYLDEKKKAEAKASA